MRDPKTNIIRKTIFSILFLLVVTNSQSSFYLLQLFYLLSLNQAFQNFQQLYQYNHLIVYYETIQPLLQYKNGAVLKKLNYAILFIYNKISHSTAALVFKFVISSMFPAIDM